MENKKNLDAVIAKCSGCGSAMNYYPASQNLKCPNCGLEKELKKSFEYKKHGINEAKEEKHSEWKTQNKILKCVNCGAEIILNNLEYSGKCHYCGSSYSSVGSNLPDFTPDCVIPFVFDENEAGNRFKEQLKRKYYVPSYCKKNVQPENIVGTYIPSFVFDAYVKAEYNGRLTKSHTTQIGKSTQTYTETFNISGTQKNDIKDVIVENSSKLTQQTLKKILPFKMEKACKFSEGFILGYVVEHYENAFNVCYEQAKSEMNERIKTEILKKYDYDSVQYFDMKCGFENEKYLYSLVPVY